MAAPPKPWERLGDINHRQPIYQPDQTPSFIPSSPYTGPGNGGGGSMAPPPSCPPLPPRPVSTMSSYNTMSYPRPAFGNYGTMGMYNNGMYGGTYRGYGQYGMTGLPNVSDESGFLQIAEDSSRQAFHNIESIVHAFGSVSMMLESTYHAVYSTFRAVLGVAEHFNRMKSHFAQIFSALAVVRTLRWLYYRLLYLIGLRSQDPSLESAWRNSSTSLPGASQITEADLKASKSSWPIILFLGVVFGGPYLIWRLLSTLAPTKTKTQRWMMGQEEHYAAVAQYPFQAKMRNELTFGFGQQLVLAPKDQQPSVQGWLLASNGRNVGLVPANYIKILGLRPPVSQQRNTQQKQQGNQMVASGIPSIPSPQLGNHQPISQHTAPITFTDRRGTPYPQPRQTLPTATHQGVPPTTWQRPPLTTQQGTPLTTQLRPPLTTQQGTPLTTQLRPPLTTQQGTPLTTQQGTPLTTQQGTPLTTQQGTPLTTQQGTPLTTQQTPPLTTQQGTPLITQLRPPLTTQQRPPLTTQQGTPLTTQQGTPLTTQQTPPLTTQQGTPLTTQLRPPLTTQQDITSLPPKTCQSTLPLPQHDTAVTSQNSPSTPVDTSSNSVNVDAVQGTRLLNEEEGLDAEEF